MGNPVILTEKFGTTDMAAIETFKSTIPCKVCGLFWKDHMNEKCFASRMLHTKFPNGHNLGNDQYGALCTVCGERSGQHYGNTGLICPKDNAFCLIDYKKFESANYMYNPEGIHWSGGKQKPKVEDEESASEETYSDGTPFNPDPDIVQEKFGVSYSDKKALYYEAKCKVCGLSWASHTSHKCDPKKIKAHKFPNGPVEEDGTIYNNCTVCGEGYGGHWYPNGLLICEKDMNNLTGKESGPYHTLYSNMVKEDYMVSGKGEVVSKPDFFKLKFGYSLTDSGDDIFKAICKVCGLSFKDHIGYKCACSAITLAKFPDGQEKVDEDGWYDCKVCGESGSKHYMNGKVCPANMKEIKNTILYGNISFGYNQEYLDKEEVPTKAKTKKSVPYVPPYQPRTQKARGISALKEYSRRVPNFEVIPIEKVEPKQLVGKFVRPCPMRPRHGFVDSRLITNLEEAELIIRQTKEADPEAEFLLMKKIDAQYSGIYTPGMLAIGQGNDGATTGTAAKTIVTIGTPFDSYISGYGEDTVLKKADIKTSPYLELLWEKSYDDEEEYGNRPYEVQLRDGPALPQTVDFIPEPTEVREVVVAEGDLLEWETKVKTMPAGTVVHHPGGTLASHYAVHAAINKIPVMISRQPKIGEKLVQTMDKKDTSIRKLRAGYMLANMMQLDKSEAAFLMLAGCHHTAVWKGKHDVLLGAAIGAAYRLTVIAALGEYRHYANNTVEGQALGKKGSKLSREQVYNSHWETADKAVGRFKFREAVQSFANDSWCSGYGGKSWYKFTQWAIQMHNALVEGNADRALETLNSLVHSAHNNGWGFNKFIGDRELDNTARSPVYAAMRCANLIYTIESLDVKGLCTKFKRYRRLIKPVETDISLKSTLKAKPPAFEEDIEIDDDDSSNHCGDNNCKGCNDLYGWVHGAPDPDEQPKSTKTKPPKAGYPESPVLYAQMKINGDHFHIQYVTEMEGSSNFPAEKGVGNKQYRVTDGNFKSMDMKYVKKCYELAEKTTSLAGSNTIYAILKKKDGSWFFGNPNGEFWYINPVTGNN